MSAGLMPPEVVEKILTNGYTLEIVKSGNGYRAEMTSPGSPTISNEFQLGKEITLDGPGGLKLKSISKLDGNKIVEDATAENGLKLNIVREIINGELKMVTTSQAGEMTQYFKRC
uniref:Lipocalin/cytosolic fatty-acid binding domain-containing protein n=1 Tax=Biomphalaria glabrata TaxID=6526 RepID=A0A2C9KZA2_BIOGL